jgi:hypothetical protein
MLRAGASIQLEVMSTFLRVTSRLLEKVLKPRYNARVCGRDCAHHLVLLDDLQR